MNFRNQRPNVITADYTKKHRKPAKFCGIQNSKPLHCCELRGNTKSRAQTVTLGDLKSHTDDPTVFRFKTDSIH